MKKMMAMLLASVMAAGTFTTTAFAYTGDDVQKNTSVSTAIFLFQKFRPSCNQFVTVKFFRLCAFDRVCGVVCQSLLPPTSVCRLRGVIGAKLAALVLPLFKKQAHIRVELRRALSIKGNRAPPLLAAGRVLHIDLENE